MSFKYYIVKLEDGVWLAGGDGDPCRTTKDTHAKKFEKFTQAKAALKAARVYRPFINARIVECTNHT